MNSIPIAFIVIIPLAVIALVIVSFWRIFEKAGLAGWKSIIPFYNLYCLTIIAKLKWWWFLLMLIPYAGGLISIYVYIRMAKSFNKSVLYAIGLIFLPFIFLPMLAFGDAQYDFSEVEEKGDAPLQEGVAPAVQEQVPDQKPVTSEVKAPESTPSSQAA